MDLDGVHLLMDQMRGEIGQGQRHVENRLRQMENKSDTGQNNSMQLLGQFQKEFRDFVRDSRDKLFRNRLAGLPANSSSTSRQYRELQEENTKLANRNKNLQEINQATGVENAKLMKEVQVMRSKLISLKPIRTELLGDIGGSKYHDLIARLDSAQAVEFIESMIDRWVAELYYAMMANQETQKLRRTALTSMAKRLAGLIPFLASPNEKGEFGRALEKDPLGVAFELHEQILASSQRFRFEFESASEVGRKFCHSSDIKHIMEIANRLDITNACSSGAKLDFKKLKP
ncbi:hypothetical protein DL766_007587 [Monosporascus sp. MC13-8B]|uniref:Uncharacterized protein n=1 Tax=Monosporascus cannonballus TaxID=155416 RepID=A0ABY0HFN4_9PEZI|nr:hypothetical protein DL763_011577 [Monosporascus cannonballus]RYO91536.1 hypothetical protein DL762_002150 [Monosporascus cannonballus]RYP22967.1 hypothetical protein DL766_007587 [Monosporascus sp. MC13-8B]